MMCYILTTDLGSGDQVQTGPISRLCWALTERKLHRIIRVFTAAKAYKEICICAHSFDIVN